MGENPSESEVAEMANGKSRTLNTEYIFLATPRFTAFRYADMESVENFVWGGI